MLICPGCRTVYTEQLEVCPKDNLPLIVRSPTAVEEEPGTETALTGGLMVGEYRIEETILDEEIGTTYSAIHPLIRKRVAIRVLHSKYAEDPKAVARFVMEARAVNEIGHHNIVDVLSIGELMDGRNYLVMELLDGLTLREILRRQQRLEPAEVSAVFEQVCDALQAAHNAGFVHRDLQPENMVVLRRPPHPFVKIQDFGLAKLKGGEAAERDVATLVGTPAYMAPELCKGHEIDIRIDIYSLGVIMYELLTGRLPFAVQGLVHAFTTNTKLSPKDPAELNPMVGHNLEQVVLKAMAWEPEGRYESMAAVGTALREAVPPGRWTISLSPARIRRPTSPGQVALPPEPHPPKVDVPAPESIVGEMAEEEIERTAGRAVVQPMRRTGPKTLLGHNAPESELDDGAPESELDDEAPTDIFTGGALPKGMSPASDGTLEPDAFLGDVASGEVLGEADTEVSEPPPFRSPTPRPVAQLVSSDETLPPMDVDLDEETQPPIPLDETLPRKGGFLPATTREASAEELERLAKPARREKKADFLPAATREASAEELERLAKPVRKAAKTPAGSEGEPEPVEKTLPLPSLEDLVMAPSEVPEPTDSDDGDYASIEIIDIEEALRDEALNADKKDGEK